MSGKDRSLERLKYRRLVQHVFLRDYAKNSSSVGPKGQIRVNDTHEKRKRNGRYIENHYNQALLPSMGTDVSESMGFEAVLNLVGLTGDEKDLFIGKWKEYKRAEELAVGEGRVFAGDYQALSADRSEAIDDLLNPDNMTSEQKEKIVMAVLHGFVEKGFPLLKSIREERELTDWVAGEMSAYSSDCSSFTVERMYAFQVLRGLSPERILGGGRDSLICDYFGVESKETLLLVLFHMDLFKQKSPSTRQLSTMDFKNFLMQRKESCESTRLLFGESVKDDKDNKTINDESEKKDNLLAAIDSGHFDALYEKVYAFEYDHGRPVVAPVYFNAWKKEVDTAFEEGPADEGTLLALQESLVAGYCEGKSALNELVKTLEKGENSFLLESPASVAVVMPYLVSEILKAPEGDFKDKHLKILLGKYLLVDGPDGKEISPDNFLMLINTMKRVYEETSGAPKDDQLKEHDCDLVFELLASTRAVVDALRPEQLTEIEGVDPDSHRAMTAYKVAGIAAALPATEIPAVRGFWDEALKVSASEPLTEKAVVELREKAQLCLPTLLASLDNPDFKQLLQGSNSVFPSIYVDLYRQAKGDESAQVKLYGLLQAWLNSPASELNNGRLSNLVIGLQQAKTSDQRDLDHVVTLLEKRASQAENASSNHFVALSRALDSVAGNTNKMDAIHGKFTELLSNVGGSTANCQKAIALAKALDQSPFQVGGAAQTVQQDHVAELLVDQLLALLETERAAPLATLSSTLKGETSFKAAISRVVKERRAVIEPKLASADHNRKQVVHFLIGFGLLLPVLWVAAVFVAVIANNVHEKLSKEKASLDKIDAATSALTGEPSRPSSSAGPKEGGRGRVSSLPGGLFNKKNITTHRSRSQSAPVGTASQEEADSTTFHHPGPGC